MSDTRSNPSRTPVPIEVGQVSNFKSDSFSGALEWLSDMDWNGIPIQVGHSFQSKSDTCSKANRTGIPIPSRTVFRGCWGLGPPGPGTSRSEWRDATQPAKRVPCKCTKKGTSMAQTPLSMRQIKEILRLKYQHQLSVRAIARSCGLSPSTVGDYLRRAKAAGLNWPLPEELSEAQLLEQLLGVTQAQSPNQAPRPLPEWPKVHQELRRPNVTVQLVWQEYDR